ncbi:MAG TPA: tetraacyldisaccharide 4'-kinase [Terracidiphilus sp.]|nr:tetraacyldisaccharide 4'-kinase [Terracidiphilus sp.]
MRRPWLAPLVPLYAAGVALREWRFAQGGQQAQRLHWPVISVGNLSMGGSGKTPLIIALAKLLTARGVQVDVLSRGYGRHSKEPARVLPDGTAEQFGDEPVLIARETGVPVYVAAKRYEAGILAESEPDVAGSRHVHLLDDGFQHRQLARDVDILILSHDDVKDSLLPAGNLRERFRAATRADLLAIPANDVQLESDLRAWGWRGPIWRLHRRMEIPGLIGPVAAFCGIARPNQFFAGLEACGAQIVARKAFRDHDGYTQHTVERLAEQARSSNAFALITTEKDLVRLGSLALAFPPDLPLLTARLSIEIQDETAVVDSLLESLDFAPPHPSL